MKTGAVIAAAGLSRRMGGGSKPFLTVAGRPVLAWTLAAFEAAPEITEIVVVVRADEMERCQRETITPFSFTKIKTVVAGGAERQDSVRLGLAQLSTDCELAAIHDGARLMVTPELIGAAVAAAAEKGAVTVAVQAKDTIKLASKDGSVQETLPRQLLWAVQTPQVFRREVILTAHEVAAAAGFTGTDDCSLVERLGVPVWLVPGSYENFKLTTPEDVVYAESLLSRRGWTSPGRGR